MFIQKPAVTPSAPFRMLFHLLKFPKGRLSPSVRHLQADIKGYSLALDSLTRKCTYSGIKVKAKLIKYRGGFLQTSASIQIALDNFGIVLLLSATVYRIRLLAVCGYYNSLNLICICKDFMNHI